MTHTLTCLHHRFSLVIARLKKTCPSQYNLYHPDSYEKTTIFYEDVPIHFSS
jgi:hypothetical protein